MRRFLCALSAALSLVAWIGSQTFALAQGAIQQSGAVTPYHAPAWYANGVVGDAGAVSRPGLSALGLFGGSNCPLGISSQAGPGATPAAYAQMTFCQTGTTSRLTFAGINGNANPAVYFNIGGIDYGFPGPGNGNVAGPGSAVDSHFACFNTTSGKTIKDCGYGPSSLAFNVATYGATGNNTASADLTGFQNAIAAACATATATGGVAEVDVPVPPVAYLISTALPVCSNLHIHGIGGRPTIVFTGTGLIGAHTALFTNTGKDNVEIDHLELDGQNHAYAYAYAALTDASSALQFSMHDTFFNNWGTGTTGGWVSIESDSGSNTFWHNYGVADTANFNITAPTDSLHFYDNLLSATNGTCFVIASAAGGAATAKIDHNILECEGGGAMHIDTLGQWIVQDNEEETLGAITNAHSAVYDIVSWTLGQFDRNDSNSHGFADYDFYVGNAVTNSEFGNNIAVSAAVSAFKVGSGGGNVYLYNNSGNGPSHVYDRDYLGIMTNQLYGGNGFGFGCGTTVTTINSTFCVRLAQISAGTATTLNAQFLSPAVGSGNTVAINIGHDVSTGNVGEFGMIWYANNDARNRARFGLSNGQPVNVDINGNLSTTAGGGISTTGTVTSNIVSTNTVAAATMVSATAYTVGVTAGVSCASGTVVAATMVVVNGIVTHC